MFGTRKTKARKIHTIGIFHMTDTEYATKRVQWIQNHIFREHIGKNDAFLLKNQLLVWQNDVSWSICRVPQRLRLNRPDPAWKRLHFLFVALQFVSTSTPG